MIVHDRTRLTDPLSFSPFFAEHFSFFEPFAQFFFFFAFLFVSVIFLIAVFLYVFCLGNHYLLCI